jgi:hypothetical protein
MKIFASFTAMGYLGTNTTAAYPQWLGVAHLIELFSVVK